MSSVVPTPPTQPASADWFDRALRFLREAPWVRAIPVIIVTFVVAGVATVVAATLYGRELPLPDLVPLALGYLPAIVVLIAAWMLLEREPLSAFGYTGGAWRITRGLLGGFLLGVGVLGTVALVGLGLGHYTFRAQAIDWPGLITCLPVLLVAAHFEEVTTRGYMLQCFARRWPVVGLAITSLIFALLHAFNPGVWDNGPEGGLLAMAGVGLAGVWLGLVFLRSGDLWLPTGVHLGWNWAQGCLLGLPVSGMKMPSLLTGTLAHPESVLTGGPFGPEASPVAVLILALLCVTWAVAFKQPLENPVAALQRRRAEAAAAASLLPPPMVPASDLLAAVPASDPPGEPPTSDAETET